MNSKKASLQLFGNRVLVLELPEDELKSGLIIPDGAKDSLKQVPTLGRGKVCGIGSECTKFNIGDVVYVQITRMETPFVIDKELYGIFREEQIIAREQPVVSLNPIMN